jgi:outer membrane protein TolC
MEEFYKIGAEYEFMDSLCHTLFDVKRKYYALLRAQAILKVAQNNVEINERFLKLAQNNKSQPDTETAKLYLEDAQVLLLEAQNNYKNAKIDLNNSMYLSSQPEYTIKDTHTFSYKENIEKSDSFEPELFTFPLDKAVDIAYENSPDLQVLINTKKAMEESLKYVKRKYLPSLRANVGYGYLNTNIKSPNNNLTVGVNLTSDVNLMELKHSIKGASAQLNMADNEIELFKKDLYFEVKRALNNVEKTQSQIPITKSSVNQALKTLQMVEQLYKINNVNYSSLQDARKDYILALNQYIDTMYNYNYSLIQLEQAMHYHIVDIHHKSDHAVHYHSDELIKHLNEALGCDEKEIKNKKKH